MGTVAGYIVITVVTETLGMIGIVGRENHLL